MATSQLRVADITHCLESIAPLHLAESWDRPGLCVGDPSRKVVTVLTALELTDEVIAEAEALKADLLVLHHPPIFEPLSNLRDNSPDARRLLQAVRSRLSIYATHTNWDLCPLSMSAEMLRRAGVKNPKPLLPRPQRAQAKIIVFCPPDHTEPVRDAMAEAGAGVIGEYDHCSFKSPGTGSFRGSMQSDPFVGRAGCLEAVSEERLEMVCPRGKISAVVSALVGAHPYEEPAYDIYSLEDFRTEAHYLWSGELQKPVPLHELAGKEGRIIGEPRKRVRKLAAASGSRETLLKTVAGFEVEAFLTGEVSHHDARRAQDLGVNLVDLGHYGTEVTFGPIAAAYLRKSLRKSGIRILASRKIRPPWRTAHA